MCWRSFCCCLALAVFFSVYTLFVWHVLAKEFRGPEFLSETFNDGGCELMAEDMIRGGAHMQLWMDGVAIVSAGDFNTTFNHAARKARGVGLFAVNLKARPRPTVRKLELEGWPKGEPPLVGDGLFLSNTSRRLYVVNHGGKEEDLGELDAEFEVGELVQAICCCCSANLWQPAYVLAKQGGGTYLLQWIPLGIWDQYMDTTKHAHEMRKLKLKRKKDHYIAAYDTIGCPMGQPPDPRPMTEAECRNEATHIGEPGLPFVTFSDEEPSGCFLLFNKTRHFNANSEGVGRRAGRQIICKTTWQEHENELKFVVATGQEEEWPESSVAIFDLEGNSFETLRARFVERVAADAFPYHGITDVVEGRGPDELYVLVTAAWRSIPHMPFLHRRGRNSDQRVNRAVVQATRWLRGLGLRSWVPTITWLIRNHRKTMGYYDYWDSPAGGDLGVVRCARRPDPGEGEVHAGLRWECRMTRATGFPLVRSMTVSPDRTHLFVSVINQVWRFRIEADGELTEVGQPLDLSRQGVVVGMHWEQRSRSILYSIIPAPILVPGYTEKSRQRPGLPADLFVGAEIEPPGWFSLLWDLVPRPAPKLVLRHDGSLQGGMVSSWVGHEGTVLVGSTYEEGLLYCRKTQPLPKPEFHVGDRVWGLWSSAQRHDWRLATVLHNFSGSVRLVWDELGGPGNKQASSLPWHKVRSISAARKATGPPRVGDRVLALQVNSSSWAQATVEEEDGEGNYTVTWDEQVVAPHNIKRPPLRVLFSTTAGATAKDWIVDTGAAFKEWTPTVAYGWTQERGECQENDSGTCAADEASNSSSGELPTWELRLPEGAYEVAVALRGAARQARAAPPGTCAVEGLQLNASGAVVVRVSDGFLTLSGCRGLVESVDVRDTVEDLKKAVPFFFAHMGRDYVIGQFEVHKSTEIQIPPPPVGPLFLRRLPASLHAENTTIVVSVRGGSCGPGSVVSFQPDSATLAYFHNGSQFGWRPLQRVQVLAGSVKVPPTSIFTGNFKNMGWILGSLSGSEIVTFASSYSFTDDFDFCNGNPMLGGELVTLSYVIGAPFGVREPSELQPGEHVWAWRGGNTGGEWKHARLERRRNDGTFVVAWHREEEAGRVLPLDRLQRSQETGYRRLRAGAPALKCGGHHSWTHPVAGEEQCMRLCDVRPLCRFVAHFPDVGHCLTSTACSAFEASDVPLGSSSSIFQKLAPPSGDGGGAMEVS